MDPEIDSLTPAAWPARVTVELVDGRKISEYVQYPKGDPENSLEWPEVKGKFNLLVDGILNQQGVTEVIDLCENIESVADCGQLLATVNKNGVW
jgi:2-methylcitrate dehydratase PrpD